MQLYLPIAELSVNVLEILGIGGLVGMLSGMFGVGGGFLIIPLLIFVGVPPAVAVATSTNQIVATSVSAVLAHWRRKNVDFAMGLVMLAGGLAGSVAGVQLFAVLKGLGQIDLVIKLSFVVFLGIVSALMFAESLRAILRRGSATRRKRHHHTWIHGLPFKMRFRRSLLYISVLPPLGIGFIVGVLAAVMGIGGGFLMVPAMIYILGMPTITVIGTSLFQILFVTANVTVLHAVANQTVDVVLALLLIAGGVIGAQFGVRLGAKLRADQLRGLLALMVMIVCAKLLYDLVVTPIHLFSIDTWVSS